MSEYDEIMRILMKNSEKSFVKRIIQPESYPSLDLGNGNKATHMMSWSEINTSKGKKYVVYPTILYDGKGLVDYGDKALDVVLKNGNYIEFDSPDKAEWFSKKYKEAWRKEHHQTGLAATV